MGELFQKSAAAGTIEVVPALEGVPDVKAIQANTRIREVWTREEWTRLNRESDLLDQKGIRQTLTCALPQCPDKRIRIVPDATAPMGATLQCGCTDRVFARPHIPVKVGTARQRRHAKGRR